MSNSESGIHPVIWAVIGVGALVPVVLILLIVFRSGDPDKELSQTAGVTLQQNQPKSAAKDEREEEKPESSEVEPKPLLVHPEAEQQPPEPAKTEKTESKKPIIPEPIDFEGDVTNIREKTIFDAEDRQIHILAIGGVEFQGFHPLKDVDTGAYFAVTDGTEKKKFTEKSAKIKVGNAKVATQFMAELKGVDDRDYKLYLDDRHMFVAIADSQDDQSYASVVIDRDERYCFVTNFEGIRIKEKVPLADLDTNKLLGTLGPDGKFGGIEPLKGELDETAQKILDDRKQGFAGVKDANGNELMILCNDYKVKFVLAPIEWVRAHVAP